MPLVTLQHPQRMGTILAVVPPSFTLPGNQLPALGRRVTNGAAGGAEPDAAFLASSAAFTLLLQLLWERWCGQRSPIAGSPWLGLLGDMGGSVG